MNKPETQSGEGRNPLLYLFSRTWWYSKNNRKSIVGYWILFIIGNTSYFITQPLLLAKMMNIIQKDGITEDSFDNLLWLLVINILLTYIFWVCHGPARLIERANAFKTRSTYRKYLLGGVMLMPLEWHANHHSGDTIDKIEKGTQGIYAFASESFQVIFSAIRLLVSFIMLTYFSHSAGIIVVIMLILTVGIIICFDNRIVAIYKILNSADNQISASIFDTISNITTVVILRVEKLVHKAISRKIDEPLSLYKENNRLTETKWFMVDVCGSFMTALVLGVYFWKNIGSVQGILIGNVFLLMRYLNEMSELFFRFTDMYGEILQRFSKVLNSEELSIDFQEESFANHVLPPDWRRVEIKNLNFSYQTTDGCTTHLSDVELSILRGEKIAFVGKRGSGKTTTLKVIRDLYHPRELQLLVDGKEIAEGFGGISNAIALVPQKPEIFASTIRHNITIGADHSDQEIKHFTDLVCFTDVIEKLPKGLESSINERGVNLSGGQAQSLALARGLLACNGKSIILLDEPTSSIDAPTESKIYKNIFNEFSDATIIASTHQLRLLPKFDKICVFDEGKIVSTGTYSELLRSCRKFRELLEQKDMGGE